MWIAPIANAALCCRRAPGIKRIAWFFGAGIVGTILFVFLYFIASVIGAFVPAQTKGMESPPIHQVFLLRGAIHTDIMVPVTEPLQQRFRFLSGMGIDIMDSALKYLIFGWGSRAFYTTAGSYADVTLGATVLAVVGDRSVMRVKGIRYAVDPSSLDILSLSEQANARLLTFIADSFQRNGADNPIAINGASLDGADTFYAAQGRFNLLVTCNTWVANALQFAGVKLGVWTPTTQSLFWSLEYFNAFAQRQRTHG